MLLFAVAGARQLFFLRVDVAWRGFQCFYDAVIPAHVPEEAVECHEHAVGAAWSIGLFEVVFVADDGLLGDVYFWWLLLYRGGWGGFNRGGGIGRNYQGVGRSWKEPALLCGAGSGCVILI